MRKLFYEDTHLLEFTAVVTEVRAGENGEGIWLQLDQTAFFPEEGGQAADRGTINGYPVTDVRIINDSIINDSIKNDRIYHKIGCNIEDSVQNPVFTLGQKVEGLVDWAQRFDFMQQHSGEHILSGLLHRHFGCNNVGFHLGLEEVTMDIDRVVPLEMFPVIEKEANEIVWKNLPVRAYFPEKETLETMEYRSKIEIDGPVRIVEIEGTDLCACCAPHVSRTGEIGMIKIVNIQNYKGGMRLTIRCGSRALADYGTKQDTTATLGSLLSSKPEKLVENVKRIMEESQARKQKIDELAEQLLLLKLESLPDPETDAHPWIFIDLDNTIAVRNAVNELCQKYSGYCAVFTGNDETGYRFIMGSSSKDCKEAAAVLRRELNAKGGGTAAMIQGSVFADADRIYKVLECLRENGGTP